MSCYSPYYKLTINELRHRKCHPSNRDRAYLAESCAVKARCRAYRILYNLKMARSSRTPRLLQEKLQELPHDSVLHIYKFLGGPVTNNDIVNTLRY